MPSDVRPVWVTVDDDSLHTLESIERALAGHGLHVVSAGDKAVLDAMGTVSEGWLRAQVARAIESAVVLSCQAEIARRLAGQPVAPIRFAYVAGVDPDRDERLRAAGFEPVTEASGGYTAGDALGLPRQPALADEPDVDVSDWRVPPRPGPTCTEAERRVLDAMATAHTDDLRDDLHGGDRWRKRVAMAELARREAQS